MTKSDAKQPAGLKLEERHGLIYVRKVEGLFKMRKVPVQAGDQLLKINDQDVDRYPSLNAIKALMKKEKVVSVVVLRCDPSADDASTDSEGPNNGYPALTNEPYNDASEEEEDEHTDAYPALMHQDDLARHGDDDSEEDDQFDTDGASVMFLENRTPIDGSEIRLGSRLLLGNIDSKRSLNGQQVTVKEESTKDGQWDVELADGSRVSVRSDNLFAVDPQDPERDDSSTILQSVYSTQSFLPNLIDPGDTMKIRGLKKKAKMNGTLVEVLGASDAPGRWEVLIVDDPDERIISVASVNLRHIM